MAINTKLSKAHCLPIYTQTEYQRIFQELLNLAKYWYDSCWSMVKLKATFINSLYLYFAKWQPSELASTTVNSSPLCAALPQSSHTDWCGNPHSAHSSSSRKAKQITKVGWTKVFHFKQKCTQRMDPYVRFQCQPQIIWLLLIIMRQTSRAKCTVNSQSKAGNQNIFFSAIKMGQSLTVEPPQKCWAQYL